MAGGRRLPASDSCCRRRARGRSPRGDQRPLLWEPPARTPGTPLCPVAVLRGQYGPSFPSGLLGSGPLNAVRGAVDFDELLTSREASQAEAVPWGACPWRDGVTVGGPGSRRQGSRGPVGVGRGSSLGRLQVVGGQQRRVGWPLPMRWWHLPPKDRSRAVPPSLPRAGGVTGWPSCDHTVPQRALCRGSEDVAVSGGADPSIQGACVTSSPWKWRKVAAAGEGRAPNHCHQGSGLSHHHSPGEWGQVGLGDSPAGHAGRPAGLSLGGRAPGPPSRLCEAKNSGGRSEPPGPARPPACSL